jgi:hypothetical protein
MMGGGGMMGGAAMGMMRQEIIQIKQVIMELQDDRDKLRNGIRKLKVRRCDTVQYMLWVCAGGEFAIQTPHEAHERAA